MTEYARPFRHDALFSSYYLERLLPQDEAWRVLAAEATQALSKLRSLYRDLARELPQKGERETEGQFIEKVLELLGFSYIPQPPQVAGGQPDFALFASDAEKKKARKSRNELDYKLAIAISESKYWGRSLDRHRGEDEREEEKSRGQHPGVQITNYLYRTGLAWGILTNGVEWRLYHREASGSRLKNYYGVNLVELIEKGHEEDFRYFYALFRKDSFLPVGQSLIDRALEGSRLYARELGDDLKEGVYKALRILAEGFFSDPKTTLSPKNDLDLAREMSLVYLYRLLFILYAESPREGEYLLPLDNRAYREAYSLDILKRQIAEKGAANGSPVKHTYWEHLDTQVNLVNRGSREFGIPEREFVVPPYNGGLFATRLDPKTGRDFFEAHRVPDLYLGQVIDLLARPERRGSNGREFVDYSSLEIRHLGSIYEGLLEYRLRVAKEEMLAVKEERREKWIPAREAGNRKVLDRVHAGSLYLVTDRGERKATGSYYTPDYIVKYIVENTLGPLIEEKKQKVLEKVETLHSKVKTARGYNREAYEKELRQAENQLVHEILSIKVLDPAMGSGHFLVEATDYLARALVEALGGRVALENGRSGRRVADTQAPYRRTKEDGDEIRWARREVVEKCIYGVDLNPLAVELAKLSLWLSTVAKDRPLSFLDHHLRCGNSLIGARVKDLGQFPVLRGKGKRIEPREIRPGDEVRVNGRIGRVVDVQPQADCVLYEVTFPVDPPQKYLCPPNTISKIGQVGLFESIFLQKVNILLHSFHQIESMPSETVEDIKRKESLYKEFEATVGRFLEVGHIWTSAYFDNEFGKLDYIVLQEKLRAADVEWQGMKVNPWFQKALNLARSKGFFHWELEFPEVFYEGAREKDNPGFDAVIGNPPYVRIQKQEDEEEKRWLKIFRTAHQNFDLYVPFTERAFSLCNVKGRFCFIIPNKFFQAEYGEKLRDLVTKGRHVSQIVNFGDNQVFEGSPATNYTCLFFLSQSPRDEFQYYEVLPLSKVGEELPGILVAPSLSPRVKEGTFKTDTLGPEPWCFPLGEEQAIFDKARLCSEKLGNVTEQIFQGLITSADHIYILEKTGTGSRSGLLRVYSLSEHRELELEASLLKPLISGEDIERYGTPDSRHVLLFPYKLQGGEGAELIRADEFKRQYPLAWSYLKANEQELRAREDRKFDDDQWYRFGRHQNLDKHERPKFGVPRLVDHLKVMFDHFGHYYLDNVDVNGILLPSTPLFSPHFILGILNSRLLDFLFKKCSVRFRGAFFSANKQFIERLPIRRINLTTPQNERPRLLEKGRKLYEHCMAKGDQLCVTGFVDHCLAQKPEQADVVHDLLAFLGEQMIEMNKRKQAEVKGLLKWLEREIKVKIEDLANKTKIKEYHEGSLEDLLEILKANRKKLGVDPGRREFSERLKEEFDRSLAKTRPLKDRLTLTDRLIDQIVYRLYSLTEEEIRIVEGSS